MAVKSTEQDRRRISAEAAMLGVLALLIDEREQRIADWKDAEPTDVVLARVGLSADDIATAMGKNRDAVRKMLSRRKAK
jgi:DNA-directed RNA polymerase specialized sigma24 family protein